MITKTITRTLGLLAVLLFATGCATQMEAGNTRLFEMDRAEIDSFLVEGETTQADVRNRLGAPTGTAEPVEPEADSQWMYYGWEAEQGAAAYFDPRVGSHTEEKSRRLFLDWKDKTLIGWSLDERAGK
jgi:hypothetical protein